MVRCAGASFGLLGSDSGGRAARPLPPIASGPSLPSARIAMKNMVMKEGARMVVVGKGACVFAGLCGAHAQRQPSVPNPRGGPHGRRSAAFSNRRCVAAPGCQMEKNGALTRSRKMPQERPDLAAVVVNGERYRPPLDIRSGCL